MSIRVVSDVEDLSPEALKKEVEAELQLFNRDFQSLGNSSLRGFEMALLRTYLLARLSPRVSFPRTETHTSEPEEADQDESAILPDGF